MKEETIAKVIQRANSGDHDFMVIRKISDRVDLAKVWITRPELEDNPDVIGYTFYLIRNTLDEYVGAVLDMGDVDLHLFTIPEQRRKGHMKSAFEKTILPHLSSQNRSTQNVTYRDSFMADFLAECGFSVTDGNAVCDLSHFSPLPNLDEENFFSEKEVAELVRSCKIASAYLRHTTERISGVLSERLVNKLHQLSNQSKFASTDIKDEWIDLKYSKSFTNKIG